MTQEMEIRPAGSTGGPHGGANDASTISDYLTGLYGEKPDGLIWIGGQADNWKGRACSSIEEAVRYARHLDAKGGHGVFHRTTTLKGKPASGRGREEDSAAVYSFQLDGDLAGPNHKRMDLPSTREDLEKIIRAAGAPEPTTWINSGGGYWIQWRFPEPIDVRDAETRAQMANQLQELEKGFQVAAKGFGWHLDTVSDLPRVMRLPGTTNRKNEPVLTQLEGGTGVPVGFFALRSSLRRAAVPAEVQPAPVSEELFDDASSVAGDSDHKHTPRQARERMQKQFDVLKKAVGPGNFNIPINAFAKFCSHFPTLIDREKCAGSVDKALKVHGRSVDDEDYRTTIDSAYKSTEAGNDWVAAIVENPNWDPDSLAYQKWEQENGWNRPKASAEEESAVADSWKPRDVSAVLSGTFAMPEPDLGFRDDGQCMLYSGKEHSIASEPECGKTWWVLMQVRAVLADGGNVAYVDFEDDEGTIVGRLHHTLGVEAGALGPDRFRYVRPEGAPTAAMYAALLDFSPALVVLDGVTEGLGLIAAGLAFNEAATEWRKVFVKPATRLGAATLSTDHETKDRDTRGRFAIGGQHKLAGLTGAMFKLEQIKPFGKGLRGVSRVTCTKDRNGGLREKGLPDKKIGFTYMGDLVGDCTDGKSEWHFYAPKADEDRLDDGLMPPDKVRDAVLKVKRYLEIHPGTSTNVISANVEAQKSRVVEALEWLVSNGQAEMTPGPRSAKTYVLTGSRDE